MQTTHMVILIFICQSMKQNHVIDLHLFQNGVNWDYILWSPGPQDFPFLYPSLPIQTILYHIFLGSRD